MKLKSFFAGSVEAALGLAREELGSEAVLVNSRQAPPEARHMGEYEVVAAGFGVAGGRSRRLLGQPRRNPRREYPAGARRSGAGSG